ncbi:MAG: hypothetical protein MUC65_10740, partial [Pontiellaceae bacterium]|nr:hypothetical protein [Pontiellaceae bacterium]
SAQAETDFDLEVSGFRAPQYDDQGVMTSQLFGDRAEMIGGGEIKITGLRIEIYKEGQTAATVTAPYCFYNKDTKEAHSDSTIAADVDRLKLRGRGFILKSTESSVQVFDDCEVTIKNIMEQVVGGSNNISTHAAETVITLSRMRRLNCFVTCLK